MTRHGGERATSGTRPEPRILAVDIGSSSVRALAFDAAGRRVPRTLCRAPLAMRYAPGGIAELDPAEVLRKTVAVAARALAALGSRAASLSAVGVSCFWHSLVGLDGRGRAVTPVLTWADNRSRSQAARLRREVDPEAYRARTGCTLHPSYLPAKLLWIRERDPGAFRRVRRWVSMDGYVTGRLQGEYGVGHAMAAGTGLYDQCTRDWDPEILQAVGIAQESLPRLRPRERGRRGIRASPEADGLGALQRVPIFPALPDGYCAVAASTGEERGAAGLTLGTSGALRVLAPVEAMEAVPPGLWCYRVEPEVVLAGGAVNNVWNLLAWLDRVLALPRRARRGEEERGCAPGGHGLTVLPFLQGERSPDWPLEASGVIAGLRPSTTAEEIEQAVIEAMGFPFLRILGLLEAAGLVRAGPVRLSGGVRDARLLGAMASILGRPLEVVAERECSALGAARIVRRSRRGFPAGHAWEVRVWRRVEPAGQHHRRFREEAGRQEALLASLLASGIFT